MLTAIIVMAGSLLGVLLWYLKRRDATMRERDNEKLRKALADNNLDVASDILRKRMHKDNSSKG